MNPSGQLKNRRLVNEIVLQARRLGASVCYSAEVSGRVRRWHFEPGHWPEVLSRFFRKHSMNSWSIAGSLSTTEIVTKRMERCGKCHQRLETKLCLIRTGLVFIWGA